MKVHDDKKSHDLADDLDAKAFTTGKDVFFGKNEFKPQTKEGKKLIGHELTHVVQQKKANSKVIQKSVKPADLAHEMKGSEFYTKEKVNNIPANTLVIVEEWNEYYSEVVVYYSNKENQRIKTKISKEYLIPKAYKDKKSLYYYSAGSVKQSKATSKRKISTEKKWSKIVEWVEVQDQYKKKPEYWYKVLWKRLDQFGNKLKLSANSSESLNEMLIQETFFNRFDQIIIHWTKYYNGRFKEHPKIKKLGELDPNLVKSMLFEESRMGTAGEHMTYIPNDYDSDTFEGIEIKSHYNLIQAIDSSGMIFYTLFSDIDGFLENHNLTNLISDLYKDQKLYAGLYKSLKKAMLKKVSGENLPSIVIDTDKNYKLVIKRKDNGQSLTNFDFLVNDGIFTRDELKQFIYLFQVSGDKISIKKFGNRYSMVKSSGSWDNYIWFYKNSQYVLREGDQRFAGATKTFLRNQGYENFNSNDKYSFWIQAAVRWLFEKAITGGKKIASWQNAIKAYNGWSRAGGNYAKRVLKRRNKALKAYKNSKVFYAK